MHRLSLVAIALLVFASSSLAQLGHEAQLFAYRRAMVALETHSGRMSVEELYRRGLSVRQALLSDRKGVTVIEALPVDDYEALKRQLVGFRVNRDETITVTPDPSYFLELSRTYGDEADRAFFSTYAATRPGGAAPVWTEQRAGAAGCTRFGSGALVSSYRAWVEFQRMYPKRYRAEVDGYLGAVEFEVAESTCACGDLDGVLRELEDFNREFPQTRASDRIRSRISELRDRQSRIRPQCASG